MFHEPKTKEEAAKYRYGRWAGRPFGNGYDAAKCAVPTAPAISTLPASTVLVR